MKELIPYPDEIVRRDDRVLGYFSACLRAGVWVVRDMLNSDEYKEVHGYDEIPVNMEYPQEMQQYPYVHVMYQNGSFEPSSLEEKRVHTVGEDDEEHDELQSVYKFSGSYIIGIYANTILERELIADCILGMAGIDDGFRNRFYANPYVNIAPNMHTLASPTANESMGTPWDADAMTCYRQFRFDVKGEFAYRVADPVTYIERVDVEGAQLEGHIREQYGRKYADPEVR